MEQIDLLIEEVKIIVDNKKTPLTKEEKEKVRTVYKHFTGKMADMSCNSCIPYTYKVLSNNLRNYTSKRYTEVKKVAKVTEVKNTEQIETVIDLTRKQLIEALKGRVAIPRNANKTKLLELYKKLN